MRLTLYNGSMANRISYKTNRRALDAQAAHESVANRRREFHFRLAHDLCDRYAVLCFAARNIQALGHQRLEEGYETRFAALSC
jgi:hypothetical protein